MTEDYRRLFFEMIPIISENRHFKQEYAVEIFFYLYNMHKDRAEGVITAENMTEEEKETIRLHFSSFMHNSGICFDGYDREYPRELLSAMVVFRLDVAPVFYQILGRESQSSCVTQMLSFYAKKEARALRFIDHARKWRYLRLKLPVADGSHALHKHPWWKGNFSHEPESVSNYELAD